MRCMLQRAVPGMACGLAVACVAPPLPLSAPKDGRYAGELCVAQPPRPGDCGPAALTLVTGVLLVQVSDMAYRLFLDGHQLKLVLLHDRVQVDAFDAAYAWQGHHLQFEDTARSVRYQVRFGVFQGGIQ